MSSIEVEILGDGAFAGSVANITDYSVQEYGSPISMTNLAGGVASVDFDVLEDTSFDGSILLPGQPFELRDPRAGAQRGIIDGASSANGYTLKVQGNGRLLNLVCERTAPAYSGSLGQALLNYFRLCGITDGFQIDSDIAVKHVSLPYWTGDVWTQIKKLMAIHQFEVAEVGSTIVVRKLRLRSVDVERYQSVSLNYGRRSASQTVEVHYYNNQWAVDKQIFPDPESSILDRQIISVQAGELSVTNYPVDMWISELDEPTHVLHLPWDNSTNTSVYSVVDKEGNAVSLADWRNGGGELSLSIGEDGRSIDVTVRGMATTTRAPYRIASSSEDREYQYAGLYVAATGVAFRDEVVWSPTGADLIQAPADTVTTIDDPMISTREDAVTVLANAVHEESGFQQELTVSATAINRRGETGQPIYPSFAEFDAIIDDLDITTFADFDAEFGDMSFAEFDAYLVSLNGDDFESQAFGGIGGARVAHRDNIYRITQGSARPGGFDWSAAPDLLFAEWDELSVDAEGTFADFDAHWGDKTFEQHARMPLHG